MKKQLRFHWLLVLLSVYLPLRAAAEDGSAGWLRYAPPPKQAADTDVATLPAVLCTLHRSPMIFSARDELVRGVQRMLQHTLRKESALPPENAFVLGTTDEIRAALPSIENNRSLRTGGYWLRTVEAGGHQYRLIAGADDAGVLYGTFHVLEKLARGESIANLDESQSPAAPLRWVNQWDNLNGTIERGYAGRSIFFDGGAVRADLSRAAAYARLLASIGINGCAINNVNADLRVLTTDFIAQAARVADVFRPWGVRLVLAVDLSSPQVTGKLKTFDPLAPEVASWWQTEIDEIYRIIPDFGGFVIKADSEGRPGPSQYGRTPAQAANVLAKALKPHGGVVLYRGFVYNHHLDWHDLKADRARAGFDNFAYLDGKFEDNVIVQIKHGPIDFQVREPVSPLFGALPHTNQAIELQITQEYTGQQRHMVFLAPMWKQALDFDLWVKQRSTTVKSIVTGHAFGRPTGGLVGVANVGLDANWLAHPLAMANLYAFGRLAWNPDTSSAEIAEDWTRLTFSNEPKVVQTVSAMQLKSWRTYESYTGPLGIGTLTDIIGIHYGPGIESAERNGWGQWFRADHEGVGMDRTVKTGTGYIGQYPPKVSAQYESLSTTPDGLLLFLHHVPYAHRLHSGQTVIQYIYDTHYQGALEAAKFVDDWASLRGLIDDGRFEKVARLLEYQAGHAIVWRDAVCNWFSRMSGIPDTAGRVGHYPDRIEAETMRLEDYTIVPVTPWETASGGKAVSCSGASSCKASVILQNAAGWYDLSVQYFDVKSGHATYRAFLNHQEVAGWTADADFPSSKLDGHTATRFVMHGLPIRPGDTLRIEGQPDGGEPAALDYISIDPVK